MARTIGRRMITAYLTSHAYAEFHRWLGRGPALQPMWDAWAAGDRKGALAAIPDEVVDDSSCTASVAAVPCPRAALRGPRRHHPGSHGHPDRRRAWRTRWRALAVGRVAGRTSPPVRRPRTGSDERGSRRTPRGRHRLPPTSLAELARSVRNKEVSARELTEAALDADRAARTRSTTPSSPWTASAPGARRTPWTPASPAAATQVRWPGSPSASRTSRRATGYRTTYGSALHADDPPAEADDPFVGPAARRRLRRGGQDQHTRIRLDGQHDQRPLRAPR